MNRQRPEKSFRRVAAILILAGAHLVWAGAEPAAAQAPPPAALQAKLVLRYRRARSGAPLPVTWKFNWPEHVVGRGSLEYELYDEQNRLAEFRVPDFVLSPGKNEFNALLPAFFVSSSATLLTVHGRFVTSNRSLEFDEQTLRVPTPYVQWFSVGVVAGAKAATAESEMLFFDKIRIETFLPPAQALNQSATVVFDVKTADLPSDPLTLCNFDVLVVTPTALAELREDQAGALRKWVRAGGSLCIVTGGGLESRHAELLNELTSEAANHDKFVVGPKGVLLPDEDPPEKILRVTKGLGRVAVFRGKLLETIEPEAKLWLQTARFLMKGHKDQRFARDTVPKSLPPNVRGARRPRQGVPAQSGQVQGRPAQGGLAQSGPAQSGPAQRGPGQTGPTNAMIPPPGFTAPWMPNTRFNNLNAAPLGHLGELFQLLMPIGVSVIPLRVIVLILAAYVVVIGPVDYFLLGVLHLRRFTWVLFPVVTIGFAAFTLWLSQHYLGSSDSRRAIEIYDFVPGGAVVRRTRIEMLFLSEENRVATQIENGLFSVVGRGSLMSRGPLPRVALNDTPETVGVVDRFPANYQMVEQIPQWRPVLNRFFWIDPKPSVVYQPPGLPGAAGFDWNRRGDRPGGAVSLAQRVQTAFGPKACAVVLRGRSRLAVLNNFDELRHFRSNLPGGMVNPVGDIVQELCQRSPQQLFEHTSSLSPNGGPELDDLAVSDAADSDQSVLVIAVETESTLYLYRCVYSGRP